MSILADTSLWIDHFRSANPRMESMLGRFGVLVHPYIVGELACGNLARRAETLELLKLMPECTVASADETLYFIENNRLMGRGIGYVDAALLASTALTPRARLLTLNRRLGELAGELGLGGPV